MWTLLGICKRFSLVSGVLMVFALASAAAAAGPTMLTIHDLKNDRIINLSEDDLLAFPQFTVSTGNDFIDGVATFSGPLLRDVLESTGESLDSAEFFGLNDYSVDIPAADYHKYDVIMALTQNGDKFSARDKGPIWIIYPMTENPELQDRIYNDRLIWQLVRIELR